MAFKKIDAPSIKELFLTQMEETILSGELRPGDKLPSERELADTMDISKTVVHEGIRELSRRGFLDVASRKGIYVADYTSTGNLDTLFAMFRYRGHMPDRRLLIGLLDTRLALECPALRSICEHHRTEDAARLAELLQNARNAAASEPADFATALFLYRRTVVSLSGNCISPLIMNAFFQASVPAWIEYCEHFGRERILEILAETTDCVRTGDTERALWIFTNCIEQFKRHLMNQTITKEDSYETVTSAQK